MHGVSPMQHDGPVEYIDVMACIYSMGHNGPAMEYIDPVWGIYTPWDVEAYPMGRFISVRK